MHETEIVNFLLENSSYICIPLGLVLRFLFKHFVKPQTEETTTPPTQNVIFTDTIYSYLKELRSSRDDAVDDHTKLLVRNKSLREKIKELHKTNEYLDSQAALHFKEYEKLKSQYEELGSKYKKLEQQKDLSLLINPAEDEV